jgi:transposase
MEGAYENSEIVDFGYNRDRKRGHAQIVIALLTNQDGCPVATEVFRGNTKDETTVEDKIHEIKGKHDYQVASSVRSQIVVSNRGCKDTGF